MVRPNTRGTRSGFQKVVYHMAMERDMSIAQIAEAMFMAPSNLYMKLRRQKLSINEVIDIASVLKVDVGDLVRDLAKAREGAA